MVQNGEYITESGDIKEFDTFVQYYIDNVELYCNGEPFDENLLTQVEKQIDKNFANPDDFRRTVLGYYGRALLKGEPCKVPRHLLNILKTVYEL